MKSESPSVSNWKGTHYKIKRAVINQSSRWMINFSFQNTCPHSTNRPAAPWLRQKQSNRTSIYWLQESIWLHRPWSPSNETECLWDMWPWTKLPTQQSEWTQTVRSHWRMSLPLMNCNGWSTTREHTGLHYFLLFNNDLPLATQRSTV